MVAPVTVTKALHDNMHATAERRIKGEIVYPG